MNYVRLRAFVDAWDLLWTIAISSGRAFTNKEHWAPGDVLTGYVPVNSGQPQPLVYTMWDLPHLPARHLQRTMPKDEHYLEFNALLLPYGIMVFTGDGFSSLYAG